MDVKETELENLENLEEEIETPESEEEPESTEEPASEEESEEPQEEPKDKAQKRIDKLTAQKKFLEEQLNQSKDALEEASEKIKFLDDELAKAKQTYLPGHSEILTFNGKHMYELSSDEFDQVLDNCLSATPEEAIRLVKLAKEQRKLGQPLKKQQEAIDENEQLVWKSEWGLISAAMLDEEMGNPDLKKHVKDIQDHIYPIFRDRKTDKNASFLFRKLTDGGVEAKMKHLNRLLKQLGIDVDVETEAYSKKPAPASVGKGKKSPVSTAPKTFTRAQIDKMSLDEYIKNEKAIEKAMREGRIK